MPSARVPEYVQHWLRHRRALEALVDRLPESSAGFAPWAGAMTTAALVGHIAEAVTGMMHAVEAGAFTPPTGERPAPPETIAAAREVLRQRTEAGLAILEGLEDKQLDRPLEFARLGIQVSGLGLLGMALDHEIHHKGQLWVYARMCGVEPGAFISRA